MIDNEETLENSIKILTDLTMEKCLTCGAESKEDCKCPDNCESCGA